MRAQKGVSRALFHPKIEFESNFYFESRLVQDLSAIASIANKSHLVLAHSVRSNPDCLQTVLPTVTNHSYCS